MLGTLAAAERHDPVVVVSGDRDLLQLVDDDPPPVRVLYLGRGLSNATMFGPAEVAEKYGVPAHRAGPAYAELALLRGDPSDGLPGVPGVGEKSAATMLAQYGSLADILRPRTIRNPSWPRRFAPNCWPPPTTSRPRARWCGWPTMPRCGSPPTTTGCR